MGGVWGGGACLVHTKLANVGRAATFLLVGLLKCPAEKGGNIPLASAELGYKKYWKLDIRFSSALSRGGPPSRAKVEEGGEKKKRRSSPGLETMIYAPELFTLVISEARRNQNITNFTPDWKL